MAIIWGTNFSIIKSAARELDPQAFNAVRMAVASAAFLLVMGAARLWPASRGAGTPQADASAIFRSAAPLTGHDWLRLAALGVVGHVLYQFLFMKNVQAKVEKATLGDLGALAEIKAKLKEEEKSGGEEAPKSE